MLENNNIILNGQEITDIPEDLFIPPDALRVILEQFEGPLDLLLYLIKKQNIDIIDIPILPITNQYVNYINMMQQMQFELASDYLVMASTLAEIKSKMLNGFKFKQEHIEAVDFIKQALGAYNAIHIRRGDFIDTRPHTVPLLEQIPEFLNKHLFKNNLPLYIATDEKDKSICLYSNI